MGVELFIFKESGQLGVGELAFKSVLVGYLDGDLMEDLPWNDHVLRWFSRGTIACKRLDISSDRVRSSYGDIPDSK